MSTVILHSVASVDGYIADDNWYFAGDVPGKRYFGTVDGRHLLEDPHVVIQGERVLHLRYAVRR